MWTLTAVDLERRVAFRTRITHLHEPHDSALLPKGTLFLVPAVKRSVVGCAVVPGAAWKAIQSTPRARDDFADDFAPKIAYCACAQANRTAWPLFY